MIERRFFFFPSSEVTDTPSHWGMSYDEVTFAATDGVRLHGWFVPGYGETTLLWFHGNAGNIGHRLENLMLLHRAVGANIFIFDYRGYGKSEGKASEAGTYRDARGALDYLLSRRDVAEDKIVYFGRSLGTAVAVWLAAQRAPCGLILESPFSSVKDMARVAFPNLPLHLLVRGRYDSLSRIGAVSCPVLVLHGEMDDVIPLDQGKKLYAAAREPKRFYLIPGAAHNDTYEVGGDAYFREFGEFISSLAPNRR